MTTKAPKRSDKDAWFAWQKARIQSERSKNAVTFTVSAFVSSSANGNRNRFGSSEPIRTRPK
jgi:hypothetical protein